MRLDNGCIKKNELGDTITSNIAGIESKTDKPQVKVHRYITENITSGDKQLSPLNALYGRGASVTVKASIHDSIIQQMFKIHPDKLVDGFDIHRDFHQRLGSPSVHTGNVPNMVAAMFLAFGQDLGSVGKCSQAFINVRKGKEFGFADVELKMPSIAIGTVGGGMALPSQSDCLKMVGCDGGQNSNRKLAEIIASVCLGAELSVMASLINNTHAGSHYALSKKRLV